MYKYLIIHYVDVYLIKKKSIGINYSLMLQIYTCKDALTF